eukprot:2097466-Rhodomonas_salina.1
MKCPSYLPTDILVLSAYGFPESISLRLSYGMSAYLPTPYLCLAAYGSPTQPGADLTPVGHQQVEASLKAFVEAELSLIHI